jgi:uncharacterized protein YcbK (DUF882 family)
VTLQDAGAIVESRTLSLHHINSGEDLTIAYKKNGRFDDEALKKLNWFLRDFRKDQEIRMDPHLFDMLWEVQNEVGAKGPIHVIGGYRSPATNAMLRSRSNGVAKSSLHMQGKAIDFTIPSADLATVRAAALRIQGGGVGYYPTSGVPFVHMDVGNVRHWPRMTREQLVKVFPNGRTVHVPSDGNPLPGYELAQADIERGVNRRAGPKQRNLIASLFGGGQDDEEAADTDTKASPAASSRRVASAASERSGVNVPMPPRRPSFQVAAAESKSAPAPKAVTVAAQAPAQPVSLASLSPNQIISARGFWQGTPEVPVELSSRERNAGRQQTASAEGTFRIGPFKRNDRVEPDVALSYAAQAEANLAMASAPTGATGGGAAEILSTGSASIAMKPAAASLEPGMAFRPLQAGERADDPWLRGVVVAPSLQTSMVTTVFGTPDFRTLQPFMQKPGSSVMMTFSADPHLGMTTETFTGSAVVFQATVTFGMRTAGLR